MIELNVLQESPLDKGRGDGSAGGCGKQDPPELVSAESERQKWKPSRYNARATDEDGQMIVWNSLTGSISVFAADKAPVIERALSQKGFAAPRKGLVAYLHERGYLIKAHVNEYRRTSLYVGKQHYRTDVLELILLASEDCNFRCVYCYEEFKRGTMEPQVRQGVKNLIRNRISSLDGLSIRWFGGEPLYGMPAIDDIAPFAQSIAQENDISYSSTMTTNGYLLSPDVADRLIDWGCTGYQITLDGPPDDHNCKRPGRDGSKTFETIHENLKHLARTDHSFSVVLRSNFDRKNYPRYDEFLDLIKDDFAGDERFQLRFHAVGKWGGPNDADLDTCGHMESRDVRAKLMDLAKERGLNVGGSLALKGGLSRQVCYAARPYNLLIGADGKIMKCTIALDMADHNIVGRIEEDGTLDIDAEKMARWTEPNWQTDSECASCQMMPACQGNHCPLIKIQSEDEDDKACVPARRRLNSALKETLRERTGKVRSVEITRDQVESPIST